MADRPQPRDITAEDRPALLDLNNRFAVEMSYKTKPEFDELLDMAWYARTLGDAEALLIAFDDKAPYDNQNVRWLKAHYPSFMYIDRIACSTSGKGHARALYEDLFARAKQAGYQHIVCEVNADPPNPASDAFHERMGFKPVGSQKLDNGKTVTYFEWKG